MKTNIKQFTLGIFAGLSIALGGLLNIAAVTLLSDWPMLARIVGSFLFPIGLTFVCFLGFNLFTGKIGYLFDNKKNYLLFLLIVYVGNFVGSLIFGSLCLLIFKNSPVFTIATSVATSKLLEFDFVKIFKVFTGSICCGALVYIAVYFYKTFSRNYLKIIGIFIPIALFVFAKFDHCIANMFYFTFAWKYGLFSSWFNIIIVSIGNSIGAILLNLILKIIQKRCKI